MTRTVCVAAFLCTLALSVSAQGLITTHRIPAALAAEAVATAVSSCAAQGHAVTAALLDADGNLKAFVRGDSAGIHTIEFSQDKARTAISFRTDTSALVERFKNTPPPSAIVKMPGLVLANGGVVILGPDGKEVIGGIGVSGVAGNPNGDEACAKAGMAKIADRMK